MNEKSFLATIRISCEAGSLFLFKRKNSLRSRFIRLRLAAAFPTFLPTTSPRRRMPEEFVLRRTVRYSDRIRLPDWKRAENSLRLRSRSIFLNVYLPLGAGDFPAAGLTLPLFPYPAQTVSLFLPFARLLLRTSRPPLVAILARNPWARLRLRFVMVLSVFFIT